MKKLSHIFYLPFLVLLSVYSFGGISDERGGKDAISTCQTTTFPILMYHHVRLYDGIGNLGAKNLSVSPEEFESHLRYFSEKGWRAITTSDIRNNQVECNTFMITFDDGYYDVYRHVLPLMNKYNYRGVVSIIPAHIDESDYLAGSHIRKLQEYGWEIASHTWHHPFLTKISPEKQDFQIKQSKYDLEKWFAAEINTFVYPGGFHDSEIVKKVSETGYHYGFTTRHGYAQLGNTNLELRRINIHPATTVQALEEILAAAPKN